jgi:HlyD family secretion protein
MQSFISKHKIWLIILLIVAAMGAILAVKSRKNAGPQIQLSTVQIGSIETTFFSSGTLAYRSQARLSAEIVAKVTHIYVHEGQAVEIGQELIKLDDSSLKAEIAQAEAQLARSKIDVKRFARESQSRQQEWERNQGLIAQGMISRQADDLAHAAFDNAQYQLEASQKNAIQDAAVLTQRQKLLEKMRIVSPIKGVVISIPIKVGETAVASAVSLAGSDLIIIADPSSMQVEAHIAEYDIERVKLGQHALVTANAARNQVFKGRVARIARSMSQDGGGRGGQGGADANIRTVAVQIELETVSPNFIAGMSCELSLSEASQSNALLVPLTAIRFDEANPFSSVATLAFGAKRDYFVWQVVAGKAAKRSVKLGFADEQRQEIRHGLKQGDQVVSGPPALLATLKEGDAVANSSTATGK